MRPDGPMRRLRSSVPAAEPRRPGSEGRMHFMSVLGQATPAELATALDVLAELPYVPGARAARDDLHCGPVPRGSVRRGAPPGRASSHVRHGGARRRHDRARLRRQQESRARRDGRLAGCAAPGSRAAAWARAAFDRAARGQPGGATPASRGVRVRRAVASARRRAERRHAPIALDDRQRRPGCLPPSGTGCLWRHAAECPRHAGQGNRRRLGRRRGRHSRTDPLRVAALRTLRQNGRSRRRGAGGPGAPRGHD